jgi:hypothetical protein
MRSMPFAKFERASQHHLQRRPQPNNATRSIHGLVQRAERQKTAKAPKTPRMPRMPRRSGVAGRAENRQGRQGRISRPPTVSSLTPSRQRGKSPDKSPETSETPRGKEDAQEGSSGSLKLCRPRRHPGQRVPESQMRLGVLRALAVSLTLSPRTPRPRRHPGQRVPESQMRLGVLRALAVSLTLPPAPPRPARPVSRCGRRVAGCGRWGGRGRRCGPRRCCRRSRSLPGRRRVCPRTGRRRGRTASAGRS